MGDLKSSKYSDWENDEDEHMTDDSNDTDNSNSPQNETVYCESSTSKASVNRRNKQNNGDAAESQQELSDQSKRETFARKVSNIGLYNQYGFVPKYVKTKCNGKLRSMAECAKCTVIVNSGEPAMKRHQSTCQKGKPLKNSLFYDAILFKYLTKEENNGVSGFQCLICKKIFRKTSKVKAKSHRRACRADGQKPNKNFLKVLSTKKLSKVKLDETKFQKKEIIMANGKVHTAAECVQCKLSFADNQFFLEVHEYRCAAVAVDIADPVPNGGEQAAYQKLGFCKVLLPSQPTDTSNKQIYRCLTCRRCIRPSSQARLYSHRAQCCPLSEQEEDLFRSMHFIPKISVSRNGTTMSVVECCTCHIMLANKTKNNLQTHRRKCENSKKDSGSVRAAAEKRKRRIEEINVDVDDDDLSELQTELKNVIIDSNKFRERQITMKRHEVRTIAECVQCGLSFIDMDSNYLKLHEYRCMGVAVDHNPEIDEDESNAFWKKLGFNKVVIPKQPIKKCRRNAFSCLTCNRIIIIKASDPRYLQSHRKQCQPVSNQEMDSLNQMKFNLKFGVTGNGLTMPIVECSACEMMFAENNPKILETHRNSCCAERPFDHPKLIAVGSGENSSTQANLKAGQIEEIKVEPEDSVTDFLAETDDELTSEIYGCAQTCFVCTAPSNLHENLFTTKSKHSNTRIIDFIEKWLRANASKRSNLVENSCVCVDCLDKINEYDLMCVTAERIEKELCDILLSNESLALIDPKVEQNDDCTELANDVSLLDPVSGEIVAYDDNFSETNDINESDKEREDEEMHGENTTNKVLFKCAVCNKILNSQKALLEHEHSAVNYMPIVGDKRDTYREYDCTKCPSQFYDKAKFDEHILSHQQKVEEMNQFRCSICGYKMEEEVTFAGHMDKHQNMKQFQCVICEKISSSGKNLEVHVQMHMGERNYQCDRCGKKMRFKAHLNLHMIRMHSEDKKPVNCNICGKTISCELGMKRHLETHTGVKKNACGICGKLFLLNSNRRLHELKHDKNYTDKIHACPQCDRSFARKHLLRDHMAKQHSVMEAPPCL